jgi:hypothetical protein
MSPENGVLKQSLRNKLCIRKATGCWKLETLSEREMMEAATPNLPAGKDAVGSTTNRIYNYHVRETNKYIAAFWSAYTSRK